MQISDIVAGSGGIDSIARELGIAPQQAASGVEALLPAILGGFQRSAQSQGGAGGLGELLGQLGGGGLLDQVLSPQPTDASQGDAVLGEIFGSRDVSRTVAQSASAQSGLDPSLLKKMLPLLAMVVGGLLSKGNAGGAPAAGAGGLGGLGGVLGSVLGGGSQGAGGALGGLLGGGQNSGGGLGSLLDQNGDGNALDDILRMAGKALR